MAIYKKAPFTKVTQHTNSSVAKLIASDGSGKKLPKHATNGDAITAGLKKGDLYNNTTSKTVGIVS